MIYVVLALILFAGMTEANKYFSTAIACLINTVLILIFAAYLVKKDFPLKSLPVVGKYLESKASYEVIRSEMMRNQLINRLSVNDIYSLAFRRKAKRIIV